MTIKRLTAIAAGLQPLPEVKVDVRLLCSACGSAEPPLVRQLIRVVRELGRDGQPWLYWYWVPEPMARIDCGYSGRRLPEGA